MPPAGLRARYGGVISCNPRVAWRLTRCADGAERTSPVATLQTASCASCSWRYALHGPIIGPPRAIPVTALVELSERNA